MKRFGTTTRIAFAMTMWTATVMLGMRLIGVISDGHTEVLQAHAKLCETVAVTCSQFASSGQLDQVDVTLQALVRRQPDVISAACVLKDGSIVASAGPHEDAWVASDATQTDASECAQIAVPVLAGGEAFADVQVAFAADGRSGIVGLLSLPSVRLVLLGSLGNMLGFSILLRRCFRHLDPSRAVPERVRSALDTMAEGVVVMDRRCCIRVANQSFADYLGRRAVDLEGLDMRDLPWSIEETDRLPSLLESWASPTERNDQPIELTISPGKSCILQPNASVIVDGEGKPQGYLLCLADVTSLEDKNRQLEYLATRDPMTGCLNRRSFFQRLEQRWSEAVADQRSLSCLMVDVDHFKSINDGHGHAMGDEVLKAVASTVQQVCEPAGQVCRYGGEEFCVMFVDADLEQAVDFAERVRQSIAELRFDDLTVTASLGAATRSDQVESAEAMLEQADQSLYHAKRSGRNRVVSYDQLKAWQQSESPAEASVDSAEPDGGVEPELLTAVQALLTEAEQSGRNEVSLKSLAAIVG